ncbi:GNAT family N-acetyltransferase [Bacillus bingmayongensis]|uniref:GNAT family N-acetyltransferase n=1 Tax=Bacillus bingmayongensis TaxID=1150157 RepID=UPI001ED99FFF|nr:GNAT family N-acetyltransferase [Bacillus bingmayongensis]
MKIQLFRINIIKYTRTCIIYSLFWVIFQLCNRTENSIYFFRLSVHPDHRSKGIAKELLHWLEDYAKKYKKKYVTCKVRANIPKNIRLYESVGYQVYEEDIVHKKDDTSVKTVFMKKLLIV